MNIVTLTENDLDRAAELAAGFRAALRSYKGITAQPDVPAGREELAEYLAEGCPCFGAEEGGELLGYLVCRVQEPCVWVESLYTRPDCRRRGVASALMERAETLARQRGEETTFQYVHPNNDGVIAFLKSRGYTVLNLIELRKPYTGEKLTRTIRVGEHDYDY